MNIYIHSIYIDPGLTKDQLLIPAFRKTFESSKPISFVYRWKTVISEVTTAYNNCLLGVYLLKSHLWSSPMALCMATRPLPSLDCPSLLSRAYMFFSEKLQPRNSKWAEFTAISLGYSMFSTCRQKEYNLISFHINPKIFQENSWNE